MIPPVPPSIGIDLDNTLIDYGAAAKIIALQEGLAGLESVSELRDKLKSQDNIKWQSVQAKLYTIGLSYAKPAKGSIEFLSKARALGLETVVISHKTATSPSSFGGADLRGPALAWLQEWLITPDLIAPDRIFFEPTLEGKVQRIRDLRPQWFIDDLPEVLCHPDFPTSTMPWHYKPALATQVLPSFTMQDQDSRIRIIGSLEELTSLLSRDWSPC